MRRSKAYGQATGWALVAAALIPVISGVLVVTWGSSSALSTRELISTWVEIEVLTLVAVAFLAGAARAFSERRRRAVIGRLRDRAIRDPLTGLFNRRGLLAALPPTPVGNRAVLLLDLNDFKRVNDRQGHAVGDRVLTTVGDAIRDLTRSGWLCARVGGDEFVLSRSGPQPEVAEIEAVRSLVETALEAEGLPAVGVSIGAGWGIAEVDDFERLVDAAELDLISGKRSLTDRRHSPRAAGWVDTETAELLSRGAAAAAEVAVKLDEPMVRRLRRIGLFGAGAALALSLIMIAGTLLGVSELRGIQPQSAVSLTTALALVIGSVTLLALLATPEGRSGRIAGARAGGALIGLIGALAVLEQLSGLRLNPIGMIPDPLADQVDRIQVPDLETGAMLLCGGFYMFLIERRGRVVEPVRTVISIGLVALIAAAAFGLLLGVGYLWDSRPERLSPQGLAAGALLAMAMLTAQPRQPVFWTLTLGSDGARVNRNLLLAGVLVPLVTGMVLVQTGLDQTGAWAQAVIAAAVIQATVLSMLATVSLRAASAADRQTELLLLELGEVASRDPLTGLFDRGQLNREIERCQKRVLAGGPAYAIALLDLDSLKQINDEQGYASGDLALKETAAALTASVRPTDVAVRIGGDEFAILLPGANREVAADVARRCADRIVERSGGRLSLSWGVAALGRDLETAEDLMRAADRLLYRAKTQR